MQEYLLLLSYPIISFMTRRVNEFPSLLFPQFSFVMVLSNNLCYLYEFREILSQFYFPSISFEMTWKMMIDAINTLL